MLPAVFSSPPAHVPTALQMPKQKVGVQLTTNMTRRERASGWGHELEGIELEENLKTMFNLHNRHGSEHERDGNFKAFVN